MPWGGAAGVGLGAGRAAAAGMAGGGLLGILLPSLRFLIRHFDLTNILVPAEPSRLWLVADRCVIEVCGGPLSRCFGTSTVGLLKDIST